MTPFTEPYDPEKLASTLKNENKLTDEEIKKLFESFERTETRAYYLHILLNNYFNDTTSRTLEGIKRVIRSTFPSEI
jgi:6-phosphogluconate dehydrogenase